MEAIGVAASITTILQLTETVFSRCSNYLKAVKNAEDDINRLQEELTVLRSILEDAKSLLENPNASKFRSLPRLQNELNKFLMYLRALAVKLEEGFGAVKSYKITRKMGIRRLSWPFRSKEVISIIQSLQTFTRTLDTALNLDQTKLFLENLVRVESEKRFTVLDWISTVRYGEHHNTIKEARTRKTCEWLLHHERFREWESKDSSMILWLRGSPGSGKTLLTSKVIDHVRGLLEASSDHEGFAFFYCNKNEKNRQNGLSVFRSYVRQLSTSAGSFEHIRTELTDLYDSEKTHKSGMPLEICMEQILQAVNLYHTTTLVLDALDECEPQSREQLVRMIDLLLSKSKKPIKVFISSRRQPDIQSSFSNKATIEIQATQNVHDISQFVVSEIETHRKFREMSQELKQDIIDVLLRNSEEMFQWVSLQIKQLLDLTCEIAIRDRLGKLPVGLKATYDEIYGKIKPRGYEKAFVDRAFMWVMSACKPLTSEELLSAILLNPEGGIDREEMGESKLLSICSDLLVLDSRRKVWRFSHLSVAEYFENNHWDLRKAHCHVAKACLTLLMKTYKEPRIIDFDDSGDRRNSRYRRSLGDSGGSGSSSDENTQRIKNRDMKILHKDHPLQMYSRHHWVNHVQTVQTQDGRKPDSRLATLLKAFLGSPNESSLQYQRWYRCVVSDGLEIPPTSCFKKIDKDDISPENSSVSAMCRFSFHAPLLDWWDEAPISLSQVNSKGESLLGLAVVAGSKPICEKLVQRNIDVDMQIGKSGSALAAAVRQRKIDIVQFLIDQGADVNLLLRTGIYGSALAAAVREGNIRIVKFLVEIGANANLLLQTGEYGSALVAAVRQGNIRMVDFLIEQGADVDLLLKTGDYGSALAAAAAGGCIEIVEFLVERSANVNLLLRSGKYGSALAAAAAAGEEQKNIEIVNLLIERNADVNLLLQTGDYGSALAAAAQNGNLGIVEFLVDQVADMDLPVQTNVNLLLKTGDYGSALAAAAGEGCTEIAKFLIKRSANVNLLLSTGKYGSALAAAASRLGNIDTVKFLLKQSADVNLLLQAGYYGSALAAAAQMETLESSSSLLLKMQMWISSFRLGIMVVRWLLLRTGAGRSAQIF